jgi:hypothetical protein
MAHSDKSFDSFLKKVVIRDSHPIFFSFLSRRKLLKIILIDSLITGSIFGIYSVLTETKIKNLMSSWKALATWVIVAFGTSVLNSMKY